MLKTALELAWVHSCLFEDLFRREITIRRVVLMQGMHRYSRWHCAGGLRKAVAKCVVSFIGNADPVYRTEHNRLVSSQQHYSSRSQTEVPFICHRVIGHPASDRRRGINIEHRQRQL